MVVKAEGKSCLLNFFICGRKHFLFVCLFSSDLFDSRLVLKLELFVSKEGWGELNSDTAPTKAGKILYSAHLNNLHYKKCRIKEAPVSGTSKRSKNCQLLWKNSLFFY
jgi:hypothetical protein